MLDRPVWDRAMILSMAPHASRAVRPAVGPRLLAAVFTVRLNALLTIPVLAWAVTTDGPIGWERAALILALLRMSQDTQVSGSLLGLH